MQFCCSCDSSSARNLFCADFLLLLRGIGKIKGQDNGKFWNFQILLLENIPFNSFQLSEDFGETITCSDLDGHQLRMKKRNHYIYSLDLYEKVQTMMTFHRFMYDNKMSYLQNDESTKWYNCKMLHLQNVITVYKMSLLQNAVSTKCHICKLTYLQNVITAKCCIYKMS